MTREELNALINALLFLRTSATDETALASKGAYPTWKLQQYAVGDRVRYEDVLYKCLQAHTAQTDWTPDVAVSLWVRVDDQSIEFPEWRQPTGAQDAYAKGAKVSHNEKHWVSDIDGNVWEPGAVGTETLWHEV